MIGAACRLRFYLRGTALRERRDGESWDCGSRMRRPGFAKTGRRSMATDMRLLGRSRCWGMMTRSREDLVASSSYGSGQSHAFSAQYC